jgi:hypothetical protein
MFEQKRLAGRHLLTFESQKLNYFGKKGGLITGNKVKKTHKPRYCEKEKDKANKRILRSLSFDNIHDLCAKKMFEQKRFAGRHLLTFESQKLNYFGKTVGPAF